MVNITVTNKKITFFTILLLILVFASGQAFAWTKTVTFENGTNGAIANSTSGFDYAGSQTTFSTDRAANGSKSAKMVWTKGSEGWGVTHGEMNYPAPVTNGQEVWVRGYYYFAQPWSWISNTGEASGIKIMRVATDAGGWHSIFSVWSPNVTASNEMAAVQVDTGYPFLTGAWQCLEIYLKLSPTNGIMRIWQNGVLVFEDLNHKTISSSGGYVWMSSVMSVWNNGVGQNQTQYVDEFVMTTDRPSQYDSKGNAMIGLINGSTTTTPTVTPLSAPTGLKILASSGQ